MFPIYSTIEGPTCILIFAIELKPAPHGNRKVDYVEKMEVLFYKNI